LRDAIVAERTAKGQPINFKKDKKQQQNRIKSLKPITMPKKEVH
jgi:hypothetical protein